MRKFYFLMGLFCLSSFMMAVYAQLIVTEIGTPEEGSYLNYIDESQYQIGFENENSRNLVKNSSTLINQDTEDVNATFTVNINYDDTAFVGSSFLIIFNEEGEIYTYYISNPGELTLSISEGTYDFFISFNDEDYREYVVIKENQEVSDGFEIDISPDEADNFVQLITLDENGNALHNGYNPDSEISLNLTFARSFFFNPADLYLSSFTYLNASGHNEEAQWNFYINDVSDRYSIGNVFAGLNHSINHYVSKFSNIKGIENSTVLQNDPNNWVYHTESFQPSINGEVTLNNSLTVIQTMDNMGMGQFARYSLYSNQNPDDFYKAKINNIQDEDDYNIYVVPSFSDYSFQYNGPQVSLEIKGNPISLNTDKEVLYNSGGYVFSMFASFVGTLDNQYFINENEKFNFTPHPKFSFSKADNPNVRHGNNVPFQTSVVFSVPGVYNNLGSQYWGMYGELRENDLPFVDVKIFHNNELYYSGDYFGFREAVLPTNGMIKMEILNLNSEIENIIGKNHTILEYNMDEECCPPTVHYVQFRDHENQVTNRFDSNSEPSIRLSAGDYTKDPQVFHFAYNPGNTVEVFYSLYQEDTWSEIELTEYPEFHQLGYGDYYEASLSGIIPQGNDVWYDVKIICTDASGNKQIQTISPAFKLNNTLGTDETNTDDLIIYPNPFKDVLHVQLPESIQGTVILKVTDLTGKQISMEQKDSAKQISWDGSFLSKGIYVFSIENNGKILTQKVIKK